MRTLLRLGLGLLTVGCSVAFAGCSGDDDDEPAAHEDAALICQVIGELCHEADTGSGPAHECHLLGHEGDAATCDAQMAGCMEICVEGDSGGAGGAASVTDDPYCAALGSLCHPVETTAAQDCHELGHANDAAACAEAFDACAELCLAGREELE